MAKIDEAISEIQEGLGYRTDKAGEIRRAIQRAQRMLERGHSLPWWLRTTVTKNIGEGENTFELPGDFLRISRDYGIYRVDDDGARIYLEEVLPDDGFTRWTENEEDVGGLWAYSIEGSFVTVYPVADDSYSVVLHYYKKADELDEDIGTNEWLDNAFDLMVSHAGLFMAQQLRNTDAGAIFQARLQEARQNYLAETVLRDDDERPIEMGSRR